MIAPTEYQLAIMATIGEAVAISRADLIVHAAGMFGFDRTGPDLKQEIDRQTSLLIQKAHVCEERGVLRLADSPATP
jgi:hypothetical protein